MCKSNLTIVALIFRSNIPFASHNNLSDVGYTKSKAFVSAGGGLSMWRDRDRRDCSEMERRQRIEDADNDA